MMTKEENVMNRLTGTIACQKCGKTLEGMQKRFNDLPIDDYGTLMVVNEISGKTLCVPCNWDDPKNKDDAFLMTMHEDTGLCVIKRPK